jgi:hypothetical protein
LSQNRWIKSINDCIKEVQKNPNAKKYTITVIQAQDNTKKVKEWLTKKYIRMRGNTYKVELYHEVDNTTMCKSYCKYGYGPHNFPIPGKGQYKIYTGDYITNGYQ